MSGQVMCVMCVRRAGRSGMVIGSHGDRIIGSIVDEEGRASKEETKEGPNGLAGRIHSSSSETVNVNGEVIEREWDGGEWLAHDRSRREGR